MVSQTESTTEIESIDVANDDLIDVLAGVIEYEQTNGARGSRQRLAVVGEGPRKMAMPTATNNVVENTVIYGHQLVENGEVVDTIEIDGSEADVQIL